MGEWQTSIIPKCPIYNIVSILSQKKWTDLSHEFIIHHPTCPLHLTLLWKDWISYQTVSFAAPCFTCSFYFTVPWEGMHRLGFYWSVSFVTYTLSLLFILFHCTKEGNRQTEMVLKCPIPHLCCPSTVPQGGIQWQLDLKQKQCKVTEHLVRSQSLSISCRLQLNKMNRFCMIPFLLIVK